MRTKTKILIGLAVLVAAILAGVLLSGCAGGPTKTEQFLFDIRTNYIPHVVVQTNTVYSTNFVPVPVDRPVVTTITRDGITQVQTNWIATTDYEAIFKVTHYVTTVTNMEERHEYALKERTTEGAQTIGTAINAFFPGVGGLVSTALVGALGIWARLRSRKANVALLQSVETGREIINQIKNDPNLDQKFKDWLIKHQKEEGVFNLVAGLVDKFKDKPAAKEDAKAIMAEANVAGPTPPVPPRPWG